MERDKLDAEELPEYPPHSHYQITYGIGRWLSPIFNHISAQRYEDINKKGNNANTLSKALIAK